MAKYRSLLVLQKLSAAFDTVDQCSRKRVQQLKKRKKIVFFEF